MSLNANKDRYSFQDLILNKKKILFLDKLKLNKTSPDIIADFLKILNNNECILLLKKIHSLHVIDIINKLDSFKKKALLQILSLQNDTSIKSFFKSNSPNAGSFINYNFAYVQYGISINEAIKYIKQIKDDIHNLHYVYVTSHLNSLIGVFSLKSLIFANPNSLVNHIMITDVKGVCLVTEDKNQVAMKMAKYHFYYLPVINKNGEIVGVVEHDIIHKKNVSSGDKESLQDAVLYSLKKRLPWLFVNLCTSYLSASIISIYQDAISQLTILAVIMPIIASLGGNSGAQTLAISIRSIAVGENFNNIQVCLKETAKGFCNGIMIGLFSSFLIFCFYKSFKLSFVIFIATILNMSLGGFSGAFIPIILKTFHFDPAQSSSIFLTGITDAFGFLILLTLGKAFLIK